MKKKLVILTILIFALAGFAIGCSQGSSEVSGEQEEEYIPVETEKVISMKLSELTTISGKVNPDKDVMVMPKIPGKVALVNVSVGDAVKEGQLLFKLDEEDIQDSIKQAKAALDLASANYNSSKERIENARVTLERTKKLYEQGAASKSQLEQAELAASDSSLQLLEAQLNQAQIAYNQAIEALDNLSVTSPISGIVSAVNVEQGEMASNAQPAVSIVNVEKLYVSMNVTENMVAVLKQGQQVNVSIPALGEKALIGRIESISPAADAITQLYRVKILIDNNVESVKPGMFARVEIESQVKEKVLAVQSHSVVLKNGSLVVYVVEDGRAVQKEVLTGLDTGTHVEITGGLEENETVIIKGQNYVKDGSKVKVVGGN
ncbi:MAG: efflux RND transporter periplasmic adaptor subunit [Acetivibrionales bacterium]